MKKLLSYLLLSSLLVFFVSACSSKTDTAAVVQPAGPLIVGAQLLAIAGNEEVTLDWQMVANTETYNIYYIEDTGDQYTNDNKPTSATMKAGTSITGLLSATRTITGLQNDHEYWFAFSAVNPDGESALSTIISATPKADPPPPPPENVRANALNGNVRVTWDDSDGAISYNLYYSQFDNNLWHETKKLTTDVHSPYTGPWDADLPIVNSTDANPTYFFFFVTAQNDNGEGSPSFMAYAQPTATPPPSAPVDLVAYSDGFGLTSGQIYLDWTDDPEADSYNVYVGNAKGVTKRAYTDAFSGTEAGCTVSDLDLGRTYYFVVTTVKDNLESAESLEVHGIPHP